MQSGGTQGLSALELWERAEQDEVLGKQQRVGLRKNQGSCSEGGGLPRTQGVSVSLGGAEFFVRWGFIAHVISCSLEVLGLSQRKEMIEPSSNLLRI